jgi:hypothetical protein
MGPPPLIPRAALIPGADDSRWTTCPPIATSPANLFTCPISVPSQRPLMDVRAHGSNRGAMTTTGAVTPITITGPDGLLAIVPTMLGFHPKNSLVLICLSGCRRRVGPVARVDLPAGHDRALAAHLAGHAVRHADEVAIVVYQDGRRRPPLLGDVVSALARSGIAVMDAIMVRAGQAFRAPGAGGPYRKVSELAVPGADDPQMRLLAAASVMSGRTVLPDRDALRRSIAAPTGRRLRDAEQWITAATCGDVPPGLTGNTVTSIGPGDNVAVGQRALTELAMAQATAAGGVEVDVAAALAVAMIDELVRDSVLADAMTELERPWLPMLISCASWTPPALAPPLCAVLAVVAYRHGDGALAQVAVDRCLAAAPEYPLAHLMIAFMSAGVRPETLDRLANLASGDDPCDDWP